MIMEIVVTTPKKEIIYKLIADLNRGSFETVKAFLELVEKEPPKLGTEQK